MRAQYRPRSFEDAIWQVVLGVIRKMQKKMESDKLCMILV